MGPWCREDGGLPWHSLFCQVGARWLSSAGRHGARRAWQGHFRASGSRLGWLHPPTPPQGPGPQDNTVSSPPRKTCISGTSWASPLGVQLLGPSATGQGFVCLSLTLTDNPLAEPRHPQAELPGQGRTNELGGTKIRSAVQDLESWQWPRKRQSSSLKGASAGHSWWPPSGGKL